MLRKKILLPFLALAIVVTAMAFTKSNSIKITNQAVNPEVITNFYFHYTGPSTPTSYYDYFNPNNYVMLAMGEDEGDYCQPGYDALCVISIPRIWYVDRFIPDFSNTSYGSTYHQLHDYYWFGTIGPNIYTKSLY